MKNPEHYLRLLLIRRLAVKRQWEIAAKHVERGSHSVRFAEMIHGIMDTQGSFIEDDSDRVKRDVYPHLGAAELLTALRDNVRGGRIPKDFADRLTVEAENHIAEVDRAFEEIGSAFMRRLGLEPPDLTDPPE